MLYNEIYTIVSGNYTGGIGLFDTIVDQSYLIADNISNTVLSIFRPAPNTQPSTTPPAAAPPSAAPPAISPPAGTAPPK